MTPAKSHKVKIIRNNEVTITDKSHFNKLIKKIRRTGKNGKTY